jgi:hypothetical protein
MHRYRRAKADMQGVQTGCRRHDQKMPLVSYSIIAYLPNIYALGRIEIKSYLRPTILSLASVTAIILLCIIVVFTPWYSDGELLILVMATIAATVS